MVALNATNILYSGGAIYLVYKTMKVCIGWVVSCLHHEFVVTPSFGHVFRTAVHLLKYTYSKPWFAPKVAMIYPDGSRSLVSGGTFSGETIHGWSCVQLYATRGGKADVMTKVKIRFEHDVTDPTQITAIVFKTWRGSGTKSRQAVQDGILTGFEQSLACLTRPNRKVSSDTLGGCPVSLEEAQDEWATRLPEWYATHLRAMRTAEELYAANGPESEPEDVTVASEETEEAESRAMANLRAASEAATTAATAAAGAARAAAEAAKMAVDAMARVSTLPSH